MQFFKSQDNSFDSDKLPIDELPNEILWQIFSHASLSDALDLSQVNWRLYIAVINANKFWQDMYKHYFTNIPPTAISLNKSPYKLFMDTAKEDFEQPKVRRLIFLIYSQDCDKLNKFLKENSKNIRSFLDTKGKLTQKTPLEYAQASGNQKILDAFYQTIQEEYWQSAEEVVNLKFISRIIALNFISIAKPQQFQERKVVKDCVDYLRQENNSTLQTLPIEPSKLAIAAHHDIYKNDSELKKAALDCIELNMDIAAIKGITQTIARNSMNVINEINKIGSFLPLANSSDYFHYEGLLFIINLFYGHIMPSNMVSEYQALTTLVKIAKYAAFTARIDEQGRTIFYWAIACRQEPQIIDTLLKMGSQVHERYMDLGYHPLHIAAQHGYQEVIEVLLQNNASSIAFNTQDSLFTDYFTEDNLDAYLLKVIKIAFEGNKIIEALNIEAIDTSTTDPRAAHSSHAQRAEQDFETEEFLTPVHLAAKNGHSASVKYFVENDPACATTYDSNGMAIIDIAISHGQKEVVKVLLELSQKFFQRGIEGTLLVIASSKQQPEILTYLIEYLFDLQNKLKNNLPIDANDDQLEEELRKAGYVNVESMDEVLINYLQWVDDTNNFSHLALFLRKIYEYDPNYLDMLANDPDLSINIRNLIQKSRAPFTKEKLFLLVEKGDIEGLKNTFLSLDRLDEKDIDGQSLLKLALQAKNQQILNYIYQLALVFYTENNEINTIKRDSENRTILYWAIVCGQSETVINALLNQDSKVDEIYSNNQGPLHIAAQQGSHEILAFLIAKEANVKVIDAFGCMPIHYAIENNDLEAVKQFIKHDSSLLTYKSNQTHPLLHCAARYDKKGDILKLLIDNPLINLKATDAFGMQSIHIATKEDNFKAVKILLRQNSELLEVQDTEGRTPLVIAIEENHTSLAKFLIESGANLDVTFNGKYLAEIAESQGNMEIIELIAANKDTTKRAKFP
ncbi:ankyrin repeat domain-containing protein [Legionella sp. D16C41]|uniref:ankyrin repeat domain-containing protein n=1 Tax=Legionella sp. D16C41 TaxID=3402688 RepID=UPI003AF83581